MALFSETFLVSSSHLSPSSKQPKHIAQKYFLEKAMR